MTSFYYNKNEQIKMGNNMHTFSTLISNSLISLKNILSDVHTTEISILVFGYVFINLLAIIFNERVNGSKKSLMKLVFQEALWIFILNVLLWISEYYITYNWCDIPLMKEISTYVVYIFLIQVFIFIVVPILSIVSHKNVFFKNILNIVTKIVNFTHGKNQIPNDIFEGRKPKKTKKIILPYDREDK